MAPQLGESSGLTQLQGGEHRNKETSPPLRGVGKINSEQMRGKVVYDDAKKTTRARKNPTVFVFGFF